MQKITFILVFILFSLSVAKSQDAFMTVKVEGVGSFILPSNMEIQGGVYREINDNMKEINGISASKVIFQQKGLNSINTNGFNTYARVFIRTENGKNGDYQKLNSFSLTPSGLKEVEQAYKTELYNTAASGNALILEWYSATVSSLNGYKCVTMGYKRKLGENPPVSVRFYLFHNYNRMHILTFEYRISDEAIWKPTFEKIKNSFTINQQ